MRNHDPRLDRYTAWISGFQAFEAMQRRHDKWTGRKAMAMRWKDKEPILCTNHMHRQPEPDPYLAIEMAVTKYAEEHPDRVAKQRRTYPW